MKFRKAKYYVDNKSKIEEKEKRQFIKNKVIRTINEKMKDDPQYARKTKLKELHKNFI